METLTEKMGVYLANSTVQVLLGVGVLIYALSWCRIYAKAGHPAALGLLMLVPGVNLIMQLVLAFGRWPLERHAKELRSVRKAVHRSDEKALRRVA